MSEKEQTKMYIQNPEIVFKKLLEISNQSDLRVEKIDNTNRRLILSTRASLLSYGEEIETIVNPHEGGSLVYVRSKPKVWFNVTAEGRVDENIRHIFRELDERLLESK